MTANDHTPVDDIQPRTAREAAERCLALIAVVGRSLGASLGETNEWLAKHNLTPFLSDAERSYLAEHQPPQQMMVDFSWRAEALAALLWALEGLGSLEPLNVQVDLAGITMFDRATKDPQAFLGAASLRPADVLQEAEANLYQQHWRVRDAQLFGKPTPSELHPGIVYERRYALSWLVGWGSDWDDVPTDT